MTEQRADFATRFNSSTGSKAGKKSKPKPIVIKEEDDEEFAKAIRRGDYGSVLQKQMINKIIDSHAKIAQLEAHHELQIEKIEAEYHERLMLKVNSEYLNTLDRDELAAVKSKIDGIKDEDET